MPPSARLAIASLLAVGSLNIAAPGLGRVSAQSSKQGLYDKNPNHLWNRIHRHLHVRVTADGHEYGFDTVDPLLWSRTRYLLSGPSHIQAIRLLDEFLGSRGERLVTDPVKRAVFQHDLWAIFDWLASTSATGPDGPNALMPRLARAIRRVALTREQIDRLPDTYAAAVASRAFANHHDSSPFPVFLPGDFFSSSGRWVSVGGHSPIVPQHADELSRSSFIVLWSLPGGAAETRAYLRKLWDFPQPYVADEMFSLARDAELRVKLNPALPPLPDGTQIALVRKMLLIDQSGSIVPSNLTESIQLRVFRGTQAFSEFKMSRAALFAGKVGGLRAVQSDETDFTTFSSKGMDAFEGEPRRGPLQLNPVLRMCSVCHSEFEPGIRSVQSVRQLLRPKVLVDSRHARWDHWFTQPVLAAEAKTRRYEWGLLQGLWQSNPR